MTDYTITEQLRPEQPAAVAEAVLSVPEIGPWLAGTYEKVATALAERGATPAGPPFARYHMLTDNRFRVQAGFPTDSVVEATGAVRPTTLPGGTTAVTVHIGPYDAMEPAYTALSEWIRAHDGEPVGDPWEVYFSRPEEPPETWRTEVVQPYHGG